MSSPSGAGRDAIRVLVADSNQTDSQLLSSALRRQPGLRITCCRGDLSDCLLALREVPADIVLLGDGHSDPEDLIHTLRTVHSNHPHTGLILLLDNYDRTVVVNALRAGARGLFCRARQPFRALCRCISVVHQGQFWTNTEQMSYVIEALISSPAVRVINAKGEGLLTPREEQVVNLVAEGIGNREIAQQLGIRENTVKKSLLRIYDKLGVSNRVELVLYALTHRGAERAHIVPQSDARVPASTSRLEVARIGIHALGGELDIDGDLTSNVLAPIHNTTVRVSEAEKFLDD
jgi:DNA-binding NarL/FixJ family response regulator